MTQDMAPRRAASSVPAVILAGGRATRMGGLEKPLLALRGEPVLAHVLRGLCPQVSAIAINANGDPARFAPWAVPALGAVPVLADPVPGQPGPLAGVLAAMRWAGGRGDARVLTWPGDTPWPPPDLVARLQGACPEGIVCAASGGRRHPVIALWPVALADALQATLDRGERRVAGFAAMHAGIAVPWPAPDPFQNINTPEDLAALQ